MGKRCTCCYYNDDCNSCCNDHHHNKPAYGNFWQSQFLTVPFGSPFSFDQKGPTAGGVSLLDSTTIHIKIAGDYKVSYIISINTSQIPFFPQIPVVALFLNYNNTPISGTQTNFGIQVDSGTGCRQLVGEAIISIPSNSTLQLRNHSNFNNQEIITCDNGINAASIILQKMN